MFLLGAEYLEAEGRKDALEAVLVPLLGHNTSDLEWLWATLLWRNVDEVKLLRSENLSALRGNFTLEVDLVELEPGMVKLSSICSLLKTPKFLYL